MHCFPNEQNECLHDDRALAQHPSVYVDFLADRCSLVAFMEERNVFITVCYPAAPEPMFCWRPQAADKEAYAQLKPE